MSGESVVVLAHRPDGFEAACVLETPLSAESLRRLAALAAMPGLTGADVEWSASPGSSPR